MQNIHLNLFVPYSQKDNDNPKENNLSRGVAILLEENYLFRDRLIDLLNEKLATKISKPKRKQDCSVNIQTSADNIADSFFEEGIARIIPVTLTPDSVNSNDGSRDAENPVPDIYMRCSNNENTDLILIEAKQFQDQQAGSQVLKQAQAIKDKLTDDSVIEGLISVTWQELIAILQNIESLQEGRSDFVLTHYLDYLKYYRQGWFPAEPFREGLDEEIIWKRIWPLANNSMRLLNSGQEFSIIDEAWCYRVPLSNPSWGYVQEFALALSKNQSGSTNGIDINLWPGNTAGQSRDLFNNNASVKNNMSWIQNKFLNAGNNIALPVETKFYLKLSDSFGRYVMDANLSQNVLGIDRQTIYKNFCRINGQWTRQGNSQGEWSWNKLKDFLLIDNPKLVEGQEVFKANFEKYFEQTRRTVARVSLGLHIKITVPMSLLTKLDKTSPNFLSTPENDSAAVLVAAALNNLKKEI